MRRIPHALSALMFNERVLYQGTPVAGMKYTPEGLKELLFFNKVFLSNTMELWERRPMLASTDQYIESLKKFADNVRLICDMIPVVCGVTISNEDSFERRFVSRTSLKDQILISTYPSAYQVDCAMTSGSIYYLSLMEDDSVAISYVDERRDLYHKPMGFRYRGKQYYWKTEICIADYLTELLHAKGTIIVRSTWNTKEQFTKVEYCGDQDVIEFLMPIFDENTLIISNPYLYLDDLEQILDTFVEKPKEQQERMVEDSLELFTKDELIEYPKRSFSDYLQFIYSAAHNPHVKDLYLTLYRIGSDPTIFYILKDAVDAGIKVHVNIELCASGEDVNRVWMDELEQIGVHVTAYRTGKIKVHCKVTLIRFDNGQYLAQVGTGNYHTKTVRQYTDLSLMITDQHVCEELRNVFHIFAEKEIDPFDHDVLVTRHNARAELIQMIDHEADLGANGLICIKCNSIDDFEMIEHLEYAATRGCRIFMIVRGVCTWVPSGLGMNVTLKSIVWDKLEHSRVYYFGKDNPQAYVGSLDLVDRKLDNRIEVLVRATDPDIVVKLSQYLNQYFTTTSGSWQMVQNGEYWKE